MPVIFIPKPVHSCLDEYKFDPEINKGELPRGMIWECPDCARRYVWGPDDRATVQVARWSLISKRLSDRIIRISANQ